MSKALQVSKIREIRETLIASGFGSVREQTHALGLCRSTTWAVLQASHKNSGLSPAVINRMLNCPQLPPPVRRKILEYVAEKLSGRYGHSETQLHRFVGKLTITHPVQIDLNPSRFHHFAGASADADPGVPERAPSIVEQPQARRTQQTA